MEEIAYKFVTWEVPELESLRGLKVYQLKEKCIRGEELSREEKNWLTENCRREGYMKASGWLFDFRKHMKDYVICQYGHWSEHYAFDRTSLRKAVYGKIDKIAEVCKA